MKRVLRIDKARIDAFERNSAGFIQTPAYLTKTGVLTYRKPDGSVVRELRHPEDVFNVDSLKTLRGVPVTNDHPTRLVDTTNIKQLAVGYVGDTIEVDGEFIKALTLTIFDQKAIMDAESGKVELSCGYEARLEEAPGVYEGEPYDVRQRDIVYNHVSIVDEGRAGPQVRLRLDSNDAILESLQYTLDAQGLKIGDEVVIKSGMEHMPEHKGMKFEIVELKNNFAALKMPDGKIHKWYSSDELEKYKGDKMEKIMIGGTEFEVSPELKAAMDKFMADEKMKMDEFQKAEVAKGEASTQAAAGQVAEAQKKADETQAKLDAVMEENKKIKTDSMDEKVINKMAEEKMKIISVAGHVLGKEFKADGLTNSEIKKQVLEKKGVDVKSKSEVYVEARYDALAETITEEIKAIKTFGETVMTRHDSAPTPDDARKASMERSQNAWKNK